MPLDIFVNSLAAEKRITNMLRKVRHFKAVDIGQEMSAWQTEDMHRQRPYTKRNRRRGVASTLIRPHSRYEMGHRRRAARRLIRKGRYVPRWSTRPILRDVLLERLQNRLDILVEAKLTWKK
jgi:hypothetical protein